MKTAEPKNTSAATVQKANQPFFSKEAEGNFFGESANKEPSFFKPSPAYSVNGNGALQTKLTIGEPNDKYEQEADAMADKVVQRLATPDVLTKKETAVQAKPIASAITPLVQAKCATCESTSAMASAGKEDKLQKKEEEDLVQEAPLGLQRKPIFESNAEPPDDNSLYFGEGRGEAIQRKCVECEKEEQVQKKSDSTDSLSASSSIESNLNSSKGSGSPIPESTREQMESSFGADFSNVRLHTDRSAVQMNKDLSAHAFTHGMDIYFNEGKYDTSSSSGKHLLAHELTHTVQQGGITQSKTVPTLQMANECGPGVHRIWGGFTIEGDCPFVIAVRAALNKIYATSIGSRLLSWVSMNRSGDLLTILKCDPEYMGDWICYNPLWTITDTCDNGAWKRAPNYVYLFHEIVHFWLSEFKGYGTHADRECMATGLGSYFTSMNYNENKLRCELGLPIRPCYGSYCTGMSVPSCGSLTPATIDPSLQRKESSMKQQEKKEVVQKNSDSSDAPTASPNIENCINASKGSGLPISSGTKAEMENSFGTDFSNVRLHTDNSAVQMNKDLHAQAFTHGSDVYFNAGKYDTGSTEGKRLLGHELTHVVQQNGLRKSPDNNILQRVPIGGPALASTPASASSQLPIAVVQQWQAQVTAGNLLQAVNVIVQEMIRRGEIDTSIFQIQQAASGATACTTPNPQLITIDPAVNGANTQECACIGSSPSRLANPRVHIHPDLVQFTALGSTNPQTNAVNLHSTLLHEFRHVRQQYESCNTPGMVVSSGVCTDCNNPEEMDAYLSEIEAGYNQWAFMNAWIRVYVNWNYLSANQQAIFSARKLAAEQKVNQFFPGTTWATNARVQAYNAWCLSLPNGGAAGACNSFMTPSTPRIPGPGFGGPAAPELGDFPLPGPESDKMA